MRDVVFWDVAFWDDTEVNELVFPNPNRNRPSHLKSKNWKQTSTLSSEPTTGQAPGLTVPRTYADKTVQFPNLGSGAKVTCD